MNYYKSIFPVLTSSDGIAYEIYLAGCHGYCKGCHSKHTWDFKAGKPFIDVKDKLIKDMLEKEAFFDNIVILGGEPLDHDQLPLMLQLLGSCFPNKKIYLYTHFDAITINQNFKNIKKLVDYIKLGDYDDRFINTENKPDSLTGVTLATTNQYFIKGSRKHG